MSKAIPGSSSSTGTLLFRDRVNVLVDLQMLSPGGFNGGVKVLIWEQLKWLYQNWADRLKFSFIVNGSLFDEVSTAFPQTEIAVVGSRPLYIDPLQWRWIGLRARWLYWKSDIVYGPLWYSSFFAGRKPSVALVVDLIHKVYPETLDKGEVIWRERMIKFSLENCARIQCISHYVAAELIDAYQLHSDKTFVTHLPLQQRLHLPQRDSSQVDHSGSSAEPLHLARPYFLYPANFWPHKNHLRLISAFSNYISSGGENVWDLVLTGYLQESKACREVRELVSSLPTAVRRRIHFLNHVPENKYIEVLKQASALIFPSTYEGFGIPLVEAMSFGVPVIAANVASIPEVVGGSALMIDPFDISAMAEAMTRVTLDDELRRRLVRSGFDRVASFSFSRETEKLGSVLLSEGRHNVQSNI